ncbi:MAG: SUMF1/EgtB/PvdO family nonheme iron enzyme [Deltaproteobacteria bacterium]|nr:SUMF1/EgtB/PvdO family nonheme iron enzyme [Deltaproteobacteria bacterium]
MPHRRERSHFGLVPLMLLISGCYAHARRDAPAPPPSAAPTDMVSIPPGSFTMGDMNGEPSEYPERRLTLDGFRIDRTEVSNQAYRLCVRARACDASPYLDDPVLGRDDHPVVGVTWADAYAFCRWVGKRLPSEAEWEYAAKGSDLRKWPWTGAFDRKKANTSGDEDGYAQTAPVTAFAEGAGPFGTLNMAGNVGEWVVDFFDPTYYRTAPSSVRGPSQGRERVVRGGSYRDAAHTVRVAARRPKIPTEADNTVGFRCAAGA